PRSIPPWRDQTSSSNGEPRRGTPPQGRARQEKRSAFSWEVPSFRRNAVAADIVLDRDEDRIAVVVGARREVAFEADAFDYVELPRPLPEIDSCRLPGLGEDLGRGDLELDMQDVLGGEIDALRDAHVAVVRHTRRLADRDIGLRHHADGVHHE